MRLNVVHDEHGRIIAASAVPEDGDDDPVAVPLAGPRQTAGVHEVPGDVESEDLDMICTSLRMDVANNRLVRIDDAG